LVLKTNKMRTEREKMLAGELYVAADDELTALRNKARLLFAQYNLTAASQAAERHQLLKELLGACPVTIDIQPPFYCDYGVNTYIGNNCFINFNCTILDCAEVTIGENVMFAPNVQLYAAYHPIIAEERIKGPELAAPIRIGDNVWLGGGVIVCPGVTIGNNTTIGAGSVVTKDIPANVVAAGNPCRVIRQL